MDKAKDDSAERSRGLLVADDPNPVVVENLSGVSPLLLLGDHAGRAIPVHLGNLGLSLENQTRHIAWDIGVAGLGLGLARRIDATFVHQRYSRLVIDCNRTPGHEDSIPTVSDGSAIPANAGLGAAEREAREREIFHTYHARIGALLDERAADGRTTIVVSLHSFTPSIGGEERPWRFGVLHRGDSVFSQTVLNGLRARWGEAAVGDNQPYAMTMDGTDYTVPYHADRLGLDYLELEVRQDTIDTPPKEAELIEPLAAVLLQALSACTAS